MKKIRIILFGFIISFMSIQSSRAMVGLFVRAGLYYTSYKFVDGLVEGSISNFVDQYIDGPIDAICSFGKGVKTFGTGVRYVIIDFSNDKNENAFSSAWQDLKNKFDYSISVARSEWEDRRKTVLKKKELERKEKDSYEVEKKPIGEKID